MSLVGTAAALVVIAVSSFLSVYLKNPYIAIGSMLVLVVFFGFKDGALALKTIDFILEFDGRHLTVGAFKRTVKLPLWIMAALIAASFIFLGFFWY